MNKKELRNTSAEIIKIKDKIIVTMIKLLVVKPDHKPNFDPPSGLYKKAATQLNVLTKAESISRFLVSIESLLYSSFNHCPFSMAFLVMSIIK